MVFRLEPGSNLLIESSLHGAGNPHLSEWVDILDLPSAQYLIAVQAWNTPTEPVDYWMHIR